jgi:hypothetical protein
MRPKYIVPANKSSFSNKEESASKAEGYGFPIKLKLSVIPIGDSILPLLGTPIKLAS